MSKPMSRHGGKVTHLKLDKAERSAQWLAKVAGLRERAGRRTARPAKPSAEMWAVRSAHAWKVKTERKRGA